MTQSLNDSIPSVIRSFYKPASTEQIVHQSVESGAICILQGDIPLIARPGFALPPIARTVPGAGLPEHAALHFFFLRADHARKFSVLQSHGGPQRRTEQAQSGDGGFFFFRNFLTVRFWSCLRHKALHAK